MDTINVQLSPDMRHFVATKVVSGRYESEADYLTALVGEAQRRESGDKLRGMLQEGEDSGPPIRMTRGEWEKVWQEAKDESARRKSHG